METYKFLIDKPHAFHSFPTRNDTELLLIYLGYDNFHFIKSWKAFRSQPFYTLHFILSGKGFLELRKKKYEIHAGDIFILPPSVKFRYYPDEQEPWEYGYFCFNGSLADEYLQETGFSQLSPIRTSREEQKIYSLFSDIFNKITKNVSPSYYEGLCLFFSILDSVVSNKPLSSKGYKTEVVQQAKQQIDSFYFTPDFTIERIAESLYISHARLCRLFKAEIGTTMISYLNEKRMQHAEELLRTTSLSVSEIASASGFRDYTHFLSQFKRIHGVTTKDYRLTHQS